MPVARCTRLKMPPPDTKSVTHWQPGINEAEKYCEEFKMWPNNLLKAAGMDNLELLFSLLPKSQATVLRLYYHDGLSPAEIATRLHISENRVEAVRQHALERLRKP